MDLENDFEIISNPEENNLEDMPTPCKTKRLFTMYTNLRLLTLLKRQVCPRPQDNMKL